MTGAFTSVASSYNTVTMMANAAMNGYQQGVLEHLEEHARDAGNVTINETGAGLWGMGWDLGKEALKTVVFRTALGALMPANPKGPAVKWSDVVDSRGNPVNPSIRKVAYRSAAAAGSTVPLAPGRRPGKGEPLPRTDAEAVGCR